jgi:indole-3-glycerol phosphate synthase
VLLIVAALLPGELMALLASSAALGLDALVEVHDRDELTKAIEAGAEIIGVNNRNLRTLQVDLQASEALVEAMPPGAIAVSESGLKTPEALDRLRRLGYHAFLIGERFMAEASPAQALKALLSRCS